MGGDAVLYVMRRGDRLSRGELHTWRILCGRSILPGSWRGQGVGSDGLGNVNPLYGFLKPDKTPGLTALTTPHTGLSIILKMAGSLTYM